MNKMFSVIDRNNYRYINIVNYVVYLYKVDLKFLIVWCFKMYFFSLKKFFFKESIFFSFLLILFILLIIKGFVKCLGIFEKVFFVLKINLFLYIEFSKIFLIFVLVFRGIMIRFKLLKKVLKFLIYFFLIKLILIYSFLVFWN